MCQKNEVGNQVIRELEKKYEVEEIDMLHMLPYGHIYIEDFKQLKI